MESWISDLAAHGYSILFAAVFLEAVGFPVPAALALLIAGAAGARGSLHSSYALLGALSTMLAGDTLMFLMGRYTGWWLLGILRAGACIYDVRSHGYLDRKAIRIRGSRRLDPHTLRRSSEEFPAGQPIFVYCTCVREATSARVAQELEKGGIRVAVIKGGLRAWKKAGLPVEDVPPGEIAALPAFG
jgi:rhodanese-related sulfurtransferase